MIPSPSRRQGVHRLGALCVVATLASTGCASADAGSAPGVHVAPDAGAAAREQTLSRYAGTRTDHAVTETPSIVGLSAARAEARLVGAGLHLRTVAFDRSRPVTVQWPIAGEPIPLDGTIEGWLGEAPTEESVPPSSATQTVAEASTPAAVVAEPIAVVAEPTEVPTTDPTDSPTEAATENAQVAAVTPQTQYILPPHTPGRLRTNPRRLPALPMGTELTGNASWYGPGFQGLTTACGGVYDQNGPTLAARELRCGTVVHITGPSGTTVRATVTDWGPAEWTGRRFDLSAAVFNAIAPLGAGVIGVRVITANVPE